MKNNSFHLVSAIVLSILFFAMLFSLWGVEINPNSGSSSIHAWTGSLLLIAATAHFVQKIARIKSVTTRSTKQNTKRVCLNRNIDLCMTIVGAICASTGLIGLIYPITPIARLHTISGLLMIFLIGIHMLLHWNWLIANLRQLFSPQKNPVNIHASERSSMGKK